MKKLFLLALMALILNACSNNDNPVYDYDNIAVIINQGNYADKNGSLSYYHESTGTVENNVLKAANTADLGAIIQSVELSTSGILYVVCNSADKIALYDAVTGKATMAPFMSTDLATPRYLTGIGNYLYITNWGAGVDDGSGWYTYPDSYVLVVNRQNWTVEEKIFCGSDAEGIVAINNKIYVATGEGVVVIEPSTNTILKTITAPQGTFYGGAKLLVVSQGNMLWASYPGQGLLAISLNNDIPLNTYAMPQIDWSGMITGNAAGTKIYSFETIFDANYNAEGSSIYEFDVQNKTAKEFYKGMAGSYFYSVGVSPFTGNVYTADVNNFSGNSRLIVLDERGNKINDAVVGVGTSGMRFFNIVREQ